MFAESSSVDEQERGHEFFNRDHAETLASPWNPDGEDNLYQDTQAWGGRYLRVR